MSHESLDELLDRSAPASPTVDTDALRDAYLAMARDARVRTRPVRPRVRAAVGAGLVLVLAGGAGAAAAGGLFQWSGWAAEPDIAYSFVLPSGRQCEERILINDRASAGDGVATPSAQGAALRDWARTADFARLVDVPAELAALDPADGIPFAEKQKGTVLPDPEGPDALMVVLGAEGGLDVVPRLPGGPSADDLYANAVDRGLWDALQRHTTAIGGTAAGWSTNLQLQCAPAT